MFAKKCNQFSRIGDGILGHGRCKIHKMQLMILKDIFVHTNFQDRQGRFHYSALFSLQLVYMSGWGGGGRGGGMGGGRSGKDSW